MEDKLEQTGDISIKIDKIIELSITKIKAHPIVSQNNGGSTILTIGLYYLALLGVFFLTLLLGMLSQQFLISAAFNTYMALAAAEQYSLIESNVIQDAFVYLFEQLDASIFVSILSYPVKETLTVFLYAEDERRFEPMKEF